jgi:4'-phosphopantetheinyl transferase
MVAATPAGALLVVHANAADLLAREPSLLDFLSSAERDRMSRFAAPAPATLFGAARALLRCLLAARLAAPPASLAFAFNAFDKPHLAHACTPQFSISHAGQEVAVALGDRHAIGIDIEPQGRPVDWRAIAPMACSAADMALLEDGGAAAFLHMWTRKEAVAKALGLGLSAPLAQIEGLGPAEGGWSEVRVMTDDGPTQLVVTALDTLPGLHAHLACSGPAAPVHLQRIG